MSRNPSLFIAAAAFLGFVAVALGAFGAHALRERLALAQMDGVWQTAVFYHFVHAVALFALGLAGRAGHAPPLSSAVGLLWILGILLFSGSLYALALGGPRLLGPITPLGGLLLSAGWITALIGSLR